MRAATRDSLVVLRDRLNALGMTAAIECLGGNTYGVVVALPDGREVSAVDADVTGGEPGYYVGIDGEDDEHHTPTLEAAVTWVLETAAQAAAH